MAGWMLVTALLSAHLMIFCTEALEFTPSNNGETLRNVIRTGPHLIVGSSNTLYRLNSDTLGIEESLDTMESRLLVADDGGTYDGNILSCHTDVCFLAETKNFANRSWSVNADILRNSDETVVAVLAPNMNGTTEITFGEAPSALSARRFMKGRLTNVDKVNRPPVNSLFTSLADYEGNDNLELFYYLTQFTHSNFIYFVTYSGFPNEMSRVVRLCQNDTGFRSDLFRSHFEIRLQCGDNNGEVTAATFIESSSVFSEPTILISAIGSSGMETCAYSLTEINDIMRTSFDNCLAGNGMTGFQRTGLLQCAVVVVDQRPNAKICDVPGGLRRGVEVSTPLMKTPLNIFPLSNNEHFTSLTTAMAQDSLFLFAGSSSSYLHQFLISVSSFAFIRRFQLNQSPMKNVTHLLSSANGEYVYAMTEDKLFRHTVDQCQQFSDCSSCLTSNDPTCGWCALSGTCVRGGACNTVNDRSNDPTRIFTQSESSCPRIVNSDPSTIHMETLQSSSGTTITLRTENILNTPADNFLYDCVFMFLPMGSSMEIIHAASPEMSTNQFECSVPALGEIPSLPPLIDTIDTLVSLRPRLPGDMAINIATIDTPIGFTNCSIHTSCMTCLASGAEGRCQWCPLSFACISNLGTSMCPRRPPSPSSTELPITSNCEINILPHPNTTDYLIHSDHPYTTNPLVIFSEGLSNFTGGTFTCRICETDSCETSLEDVSASLVGNMVHCNLLQLSYPLSKDVPTVSLTLQVRVNDFAIDNPDNTQVIVYNCFFLGTNCAQCLSLNTTFGCSHCGEADSTLPGSCVFTSPSNGLCTAPTVLVENIRNCDAPSIEDFEPKNGPTRGGTNVKITGRNLGVGRSDIGRISIRGVDCIMSYFEPGVSVNCTTISMEANLITAQISMELNFRSAAITSTEQYRYLAPSLDNPPADPSSGPVSGGTLITVRGSNLGIGSSHTVFIRQNPCQVVEVQRNSIMCITPFSDEAIINNLLVVQVDNWNLQLDGYDYLQDPTFMNITPSVSFAAGGTEYIVTGQNLNIVQNPKLLIFVRSSVGGRQTRQAMEEDMEMRFESEICDDESGSTEMSCLAPFINITIDSPVTARLGLLMDGVQSLLDLNRTITVHPTPTITPFDTVQMYGQSSSFQLTISGTGFLFSRDQVKVMLCQQDSPSCTCTVIEVYSINDSLICEVSSSSGLPTSEELTVTVSIGYFTGEAGRIMIRPNTELLIILVPVFAAFLILCVVIFMVLFAVFCRKAKQKDQRYEQLMMELERLESSVARECKLGFAELQTDLDELTGDVAGCRLPYHPMQTFLLATLFPGNKSPTIAHPIEIPSHQRPLLERSLKDFSDLLNDRKILLIFIQTLEEQRTFTIRDKSVVGSLLIVALHSRMDYVTDVLRKLLSQLIRKTVANSIPKLLLRRTESIAERLLSNWLTFCLQGYIMEHAGQPMYLLYRAVKSQLEKGPVDVITGEARYSLSEQKLIRQKVDVVPLNATVEAEDGLRVPVKLLDCDTISQVKEKLLDSMYKAAPVSMRSKLTEVDLEYLKSPSETMILRDEDHSTIVEGGWKKINTLKHYWVQDGAMFRIKTRRDHAPPGRVYDYPGSIISTHAPRQRALSEAEDGSRVWHLFKQTDLEDPKRSPFLNTNKKMVSEIYLPRMLSTKSILQNFVDDLFGGLFSISHPPSSPSTMYTGVFPQSPGVQVPMGYAPGADAVPMAIKYMFDFLDDEADNCGISDIDVVHTWKNNALALRFWVNLIKNPEFIFDINKSHTVDACLSVIAQAFIDGCSTAEIKLNIDSPTSKLLYNKEVQNYKTKVRKYYKDVKQLPRIPEDAMQFYLRQLSEYQTQQMKKTGGFFAESAYYELLRYATRYAEPFLSNLRNAGLQHRVAQFEGVLKVMKSSTQL